MRVSLEWLSQYVDLTGISPEQLDDALTDAGLEIESIEKTGAAFEGVVVGKITAVDKHPNADKLRLVTVSTDKESMQVVCGAPNVKEDLLIAFAQINARVLNRQTGEAFMLGKAAIRGVESCGMICSIDELGLQDRYEKSEDGIWPINTHVKESDLGKDLKDALGLGGDTVLETAPTANRGDHMSLIGIAREVSALFDRPVQLPGISEESKPAPAEISVALNDTEVCKYYGGAILENVSIGPSPAWMAQRLEAAGIRVINNVVDITNYVMLELGQPLHAFDFDKLGRTGVVGVRKAKAGEKIKTLDETERPLTEESVVITKDDRPVALAGVMGGFDTEIDDGSKNLFLESAYFPPFSNRRSGKSVGLRTDACARFERGVDPMTCRKALFRAIDLLQEHAGAMFVGLTESPPIPPTDLSISLRLDRFARIIGKPVSEEEATRILTQLGFAITTKNPQGHLFVKVPSYRQHDVTREIDLIEEIVRVQGYDAIPYQLPAKTGNPAFSHRQHWLALTCDSLNGAGLQEVVTNSLIGENLLEKTGFTVDRNALVSVSNSHSREHTLMRQSLLPNLIEIAKYNQSQGQDNIWIYETGRTYFKVGKAGTKFSGVSEKLCIAGLLTGSAWTGEWHLPADIKNGVDFYQTKGMLERLLGRFDLGATLRFDAAQNIAHLHPGKATTILLDTGKDKPKNIGVIGQLHPTFEASLKFRHPVFLFELDFEALAKHLKQVAAEPKAIAISVYPAVERDMAFWAADGLTHQEIVRTLETLNNPLIRHIELFDEYRPAQNAQENQAERSLAYRIRLQSDEGTLTENEIEKTVTQIKTTLREKLPVNFRE